jgi:hypothetical protein
MTCPTCRSQGFAVSVLGPKRCTFCDGTEGGNPPQPVEHADEESDAYLHGRAIGDMTCALVFLEVGTPDPARAAAILRAAVDREVRRSRRTEEGR